jgi:hypothetical protein
LILALLWALSHALGLFGCMLVIRSFPAFGSRLFPDCVVLGMVLTGLAGSIQAASLRRRGVPASAWVAASVLGGAAGALVFIELARHHYLMTGILAAGVTEGSFQWFALRRHTPLSAAWIAASGAAFLLGGQFLAHGALPLLPAAALWGTGGLLSGAVLAWILPVRERPQ